jgi:hypothetical protein
VKLQENKSLFASFSSEKEESFSVSAWVGLRGAVPAHKALPLLGKAAQFGESEVSHCGRAGRHFAGRRGGVSADAAAETAGCRA